MNKLETKKSRLCENKAKDEVVHKFYKDKESFNEYIQYMVGIAKIKDSEELIQYINSSLQNSHSLNDIYFISSFLFLYMYTPGL